MIRSLLILCLLARLSAVEILGVDFSQADKQGHFWLGAATAAVALVIVDRVEPDAKPIERAAIGIAASSLVGAGKEWYDSHHTDRHTVDRKDFVATALGGAMVSLSLCWRF